MSLKFTVDFSDITELKEKIEASTQKAPMIVAEQVRKDTESYVPMLTGSLTQRTRVEGDTIIYPGPYARYLYHGKYMVDKTGKGPMHYTDKAGNEVIRYRKGSTLVPTDRNLVFNTAVHQKAQAHWFEASKADNLEKWLKVAEKAVTNGD